MRGISREEKDIPENTPQGKELASLRKSLREKSLQLKSLTRSFDEMEAHRHQAALDREEMKNLKHSVDQLTREIRALEEKIFQEERLPGVMHTFLVKLRIKKEDPEHLARIKELRGKLQEMEERWSTLQKQVYELDLTLRDRTRSTDGRPKLEADIASVKNEIHELNERISALEEESPDDGFGALLSHAQFYHSLLSSSRESLNMEDREGIVELVNQLIEHGNALKDFS